MKKVIEKAIKEIYERHGVYVTSIDVGWHQLSDLNGEERRLITNIDIKANFDSRKKIP